MKAMILAAGRGERMRPLTDKLPKPLLEVNGVPLILHHINRLKSAGISEVIINTAWLAEKIVNKLGDGQQFGVSIKYSNEPDGALETAGGICTALPMFAEADEPFIVVNGDVYTDIDFQLLPALADDCIAHLFLVANPEHNPSGDFALESSQVLNKSKDAQTYTYSGIGLYRPSFFASCKANQTAALGPLLRQFADQGKIQGSLWQGLWTDVGTPARLAALQSNKKGN